MNMNVRRRKIGYVAAMLVLALAARAGLAQDAAATATLKPGDAAPPLKNGKWMKGEPVKAFEPGKVYVIECWATWCGPCIAAIPHVTELQHKYKDKVIVIGQNMWERDEALVEPFLKKMDEKMDYRVVLDDKSSDAKGAMATTWMEAAGRDGIPCSFIVDGAGKIAWMARGPLSAIVNAPAATGRSAEPLPCENQRSSSSTPGCGCAWARCCSCCSSWRWAASK